jgi:putative ABC transport system permease protein
MSIRIHLRRLLRSRVFLVTAILVLGLGLGVNLILFNTAYALLWRPLNFPQPERLVTLSGRSNAGDITTAITGQDAWTLRSNPAVVAEIGLTGQWQLVSLFQGDDSVDLVSAAVDSGYFRALGLRPLAGRLFGSQEDLGESPEVPAILTESTWRTQFGSDPSIVGRTFALQTGGARSQIRVIGIAPGAATLPFASDAEILLPIASASPAVRTNYGNAVYRSMVRLQAGVSIPQASSRIDAALRSNWGRHWMEPLRTAVAPVKRSTILLLYSAACLLLLLICANLASLFVARSMARAHETSVHLALGATRWRVALANFHEALLVCAAGTGLAFFVESWARPLVPKFVPAVKNVGPELLAAGPVLLVFGILVWLAVSVVVSAASGWRIRIEGLAGVLAQGGRGGTSGGKFRAVLAAGQLAIVLTLLTVSGMVGRSFLSAMRSNPGLDAQGVVTFQVSLPGSKDSPLPAITNLADRFAALPGTKGVTFAAESPVGSPAFHTVTAARSGELRPTDPMIAYRLIGPSYFKTLGARLAAGRTFSPDEVQQWREVAILNEAAVRLLFPDGSALGRTVHSGFADRRSVVVGIASDIRAEGLDQPAPPTVYLPYLAQIGLRFTVRSGMAPAALLPLLKDRVRSANPGALLQRFRPLTEILDDTVHDRMVSGMLVGGFALLGLIVSAVGLYGTLAAQVQQRQREIGVRIALGATVRNVVAIILGGGLKIVAFGALAGIAGSLAAGRAIQGELYGVSALDPTSFALALALLSSAALAACLIPAIKAGHVDPIRTLNLQ